MKRKFGFAFVAALFCLGCSGGGTSGTGDVRSASFEGLLVDSNGGPIADISIFLSETGDSTRTDADGIFLLDSNLEGSSATLLVDLPQGERRVEIADIPAEPSTITLKLEVSSDNSLITVESIEITPGGHVPEPLPTPAFTPRPGEPTPTPAPPVISGRSVFKGQVLFRNGDPVNGADVLLEPAGAGDVTNPGGSFSISTAERSSRVRLVVDYRSFVGSVTIGGLPENQPVTVSLVLRLQANANELVKPSGQGPLPIEIKAESVQIGRR